MHIHARAFFSLRITKLLGTAAGAAVGDTTSNTVQGSVNAQSAVENTALKDYFPSRTEQKANQELANKIAKTLSSNPSPRFTKTEADYLYQINTDTNLTVILDTSYLGDLKVSGNKFEEMSDGRKRITVKPISNDIWAVTGTLTLVQRLDGSYGIFNDTYDYGIKSGVRNLPRNIETYFGELKCGVNSGCTGYSIQFKGNVNPKKLRDYHEKNCYYDFCITVDSIKIFVSIFVLFVLLEQQYLFK